MTDITRRDYWFPFRIDPISQQVAQSGYAKHVDQMIRQVLLTAPGERVDLPQFGCGLRQLVFAPLSDALAAATEIQVRQALAQWLAGVIQVNQVTVVTSEDPGGPLEPGTVDVSVVYTLIETLTTEQTAVRLI